MSKLQKFETGATRTTDANSVAYHLICPKGLKYLAKIYREGVTKYPVKTDAGITTSTYVRGLSFGDTLNHMMNHLEIARTGGDEEGPPVIHLAKVAWGCFTLIHYLRKCKCHVNLYDLEKAASKGFAEHYGEKNEDN